MKYKTELKSLLPTTENKEVSEKVLGAVLKKEESHTDKTT